MPFWVAAAATVVGAGISAYSASEAADKAAESAEGAKYLAYTQAEIANAQWDYWESEFKPIEQEFINESKNLGSIANQNKNAQQSAASVASGFAGVRERLAESPGLNPGSQAYLREANRINLAEAATSAAAQSGAREQTRASGRAAMTDVVSLGKGMPMNASTMLNSAASGLNSAANYYQREQQLNNQAAGQFGQSIGSVVQSKQFQDWMRSGNDTGYGSVPGGSGSGQPTTYNNPSAYTAPVEDTSYAGYGAFN